MKYVVDTSILMNLPEEALRGYNLVLTIMVAEELDELKEAEGERGFKARRAIRYIRKNEDKFTIDDTDYRFNLNNIYDPHKTDNKIIQCCSENGLGLLTNDISLMIKARACGVKVETLDDEIELYKGYKVVTLSPNEMSHLYSHTKDNPFDLRINEYLIIKDETRPLLDGEGDGKDEYQTVDILRWDGNDLVQLRQPPKKVVKAENDLQRCAIDLLYNKQIPIKVIAGTYGSGKSFLATKMGLWHVRDKGNYSKIMMIRNPIGSGEKIGALPGDKDEKVGDFFKPIIQHLDQGEYEADRMEKAGQLEAEIPFYMKGVSLDGGYWVIVDEAEDLNVKLIKLIGTRIGKESVIVFSGDYQQAEDKYLYDNGMLKMIERLKGNPLVGIVVLDEDVRSEASKVFADL